MIISCENIRQRDCTVLIILGNYKIGTEAMEWFLEKTHAVLHCESLIFILTNEGWKQTQCNCTHFSANRNHCSCRSRTPRECFIFQMYCAFLYRFPVIHCLQMQMKQKLVIPLNYE